MKKKELLARIEELERHLLTIRANAGVARDKQAKHWFPAWVLNFVDSLGLEYRGETVTTHEVPADKFAFGISQGQMVKAVELCPLCEGICTGGESTKDFIERVKWQKKPRWAKDVMGE